MFSRGSLTLFRVRGVPIRAHWTLLLIVPYLAVALSVHFGAMFWGAILAVALFASIALHELAHVAVARHYGGRVRAITLMLLGGVSHVIRLPAEPRREALMAAAGPAMSLGLGVVFGVAYLLAGGLPHDARLALFYLASMNVSLGIFNLLPAFPMDGGRILRAVLASRWGSLRATRVAAMVGRGIAIAMGVYGLYVGSLLLLLIAFFVFAGAGAEIDSVQARTALAGLRVRDLLPALARAPSIQIDAALAEALPRMRVAGRTDMVVLGEDGSPLGVLLASDLAAIPPGARLSMPVRELVPAIRDRHVTVAADEPATEALEHASEAGRGYLIVADSRTNWLSLLTAQDVSTAITLRIAERPQTFTMPARRGAR